MLPKIKKKTDFQAISTNKKEKGRIDMQPLLRIFRFCNPQRKRVYLKPVLTKADFLLKPGIEINFLVVLVPDDQESTPDEPANPPDLVSWQGPFKQLLNLAEHITRRWLFSGVDPFSYRLDCLLTPSLLGKTEKSFYETNGDRIAHPTS